jgi:hypothetical protein
MRFVAGLNKIFIQVEFPVPKIPLGWKTQCLEDRIEKDLLLAPVIKAQPYVMSQHTGTSWPLIAQQIIEAVQTYEREWLAIKDRIPQVHRRIIKAAKERESLEARLKRDLDKLAKIPGAESKSPAPAVANTEVPNDNGLSLSDLDD